MSNIANPGSASPTALDSTFSSTAVRHPYADESDNYCEEGLRHFDATIQARLLIHNLQVGAVIGRGGERISSLRKKYSAVIEVVSESENQIPERVITITATVKDLVNLTSELVPFLNENQPQRGHSSTPPKSYSLRILVHYVVAGSIIGSGGSNIRKLRQESGATVTVFHDCCPGSSDRVVLANGSADVVCRAATTVYETIAETEVKGQTYPYNPLISYDPRVVSKYGGFPMRNVFGPEAGPPYPGPPPAGPPYPYPPRGPPPPPHLAMPNSAGKGRGKKRSYQPIVETGAPPSLFDGYSHGPESYPSGYAYGYEGEYANESYSKVQRSDEVPLNPFSSGGPAPYSSFDSPDGDGNDPPPLFVPPNAPALAPLTEPPATEKYTIPAEATGAIIGPGGQRAHYVRTTTGCRVTIADELTESGNRVITLSGSRHQVNAAKNEMQKFLADYFRSQSRKQASAANHGH